VLLTTTTVTTGQYVREYHTIYNKPLPTRGNIQLLGSGQTHKKQIIAFHLKAISFQLSVKKQIIPKKLLNAISVTLNPSNSYPPSSMTSILSLVLFVSVFCRQTVS